MSKAESTVGIHHKLLVETAKGILHAQYAQFCKDNTLRRAWVSQTQSMNEAQREDYFVKKFLRKAIPAAKATLTQLMATTTNSELRETIYEALIADASLEPERRRASHLVGAVE